MTRLCFTGKIPVQTRITMCLFFLLAEREEIMKKKILLIAIAAIIMMTMATGCRQIQEEANSEQWFGEEFIVLKENTSEWGHVYTLCDKQTKVVYYLFANFDGQTITPAYNADGTIRVYDGKQK